MFSSGLTKVLIPDVSNVVTQSGLSCQLTGANVLHHALFASDTVNDSCSLTIQFSLDLHYGSRGSGPHQPRFKHKNTHRTASPVLLAPMHTIHTSFFSVGDGSWDPGSDQKGPQISIDLVGSKGGCWENLTQIGVSGDHSSPMFCHNVPN